MTARWSRYLAVSLGVIVALPIVSRAGPNLLNDVSYEVRGDRTIIGIPGGACTNTTSTPIVAGEYLLLPMHDQGLGCADSGAHAEELLGYRFRDGRIYRLASGAGTEATLTYEPRKRRVYWPVLASGAIRVLNGVTFRVQSKSTGIASIADSAGTVLGGLFYFGTVNTPFPDCQLASSPNPDCGALFAVNRKGKPRRRLDVDDGHRAWSTGGPSSNGTYLYAGGGSQLLRANASGSRQGCATLKLDRKLHVMAIADPGDAGCHSSGRGGDDEDAVAGEAALDPDSVWVQYTNPNAADDTIRVYRYDSDLNEICHAGFSTVARLGNASSYYQAPTIGADGEAYVTLTLVRGGARRGDLYRISRDCEATRLATSRAPASAGPTLVDDDAILFASGGKLRIVGYDGTVRASYELGSGAKVLTAPVVHEEVIYVLGDDATLTVIRNSGVQGYGNAYWPRFRHDNVGSARAVS